MGKRLPVTLYPKEHHASQMSHFSSSQPKGAAVRAEVVAGVADKPQTMQEDDVKRCTQARKDATKPERYV